MRRWKAEEHLPRIQLGIAKKRGKREALPRGQNRIRNLLVSSLIGRNLSHLSLKDETVLGIVSHF